MNPGYKKNDGVKTSVFNWTFFIFEILTDTLLLKSSFILYYILLDNMVIYVSKPTNLTTISWVSLNVLLELSENH